MNRWSFARIPLNILILAILIGCSSRPGRIATPRVDADDSAREAIELYDSNRDGQIDESELAASPPLLDALPAYDANKDGSLSQAELVAGMQSWSQRGIGAMSLPFVVRLDGRPLQGAQVKLTPAPFLGGAVQAAGGTADGLGTGSLEIAAAERPAGFPKNLPVMQPGLYLVQITHPTASIPAAYNSATTLGLEAGVAGQNPAGVVWELRSSK